MNGMMPYGGGPLVMADDGLPTDVQSMEQVRAILRLRGMHWRNLAVPAVAQVALPMAQGVANALYATVAQQGLFPGEIVEGHFEARASQLGRCFGHDIEISGNMWVRRR